MTTQPPPEKLTVCILNLDKEKHYESLFDMIYPDLIASLDAKYHIPRACSLSEAQRHLNEHQPIAILLPDAAVTLKENSALLTQVTNYVQAGGFAIFACSFSSFVAPPTMNKFWKTSWGLDWKFGNYHRTDVYLNRSVTQLPMSSLPNSYSQKAVFLTNVASDDCVYRPSSDSVTQSLVFPPEPSNPNEAAVAFTKVGEGWLGYIGDVNNEQGSQAPLDIDIRQGMLWLAWKKDVTFPPINMTNVLPQSQTPTTGSYTPTPQGDARPCGNECLVIAGPWDLAVREYTEWQQSNVVDEKPRAKFSRACEAVLEDGMGLEEVYEDRNPEFFVQNGIKSGIARRVTGGIKAWVDQDKSAYDSGIIN